MSEIKNTTTETKKTFKGLFGRLHSSKEGISGFKHMSIETSQSEVKLEKKEGGANITKLQRTGG